MTEHIRQSLAPLAPSLPLFTFTAPPPSPLFHPKLFFPSYPPMSLPIIDASHHSLLITVSVHFPPIIISLSSTSTSATFLYPLTHHIVITSSSPSPSFTHLPHHLHLSHPILTSAHLQPFSPHLSHPLRPRPLSPPVYTASHDSLT